MKKYQLIDSGNGEKLEQFGPYRLIRPCAQAVWRPEDPASWQGAIRYTRDESGWGAGLPSQWVIEIDGVKFTLSPTPFGHLGVFPEHRSVWEWVLAQRPKNLLNLFAYSGGLTLAAAKKGSAVCHVDASRGMVDWARQNATLNVLDGAPIRWIVEDVRKFILREVRRGRSYDAIVMDPPSYGRGGRGEVFKIARDLPPLLSSCLALRPKFLVVSCHTPGFSPLVLRHLIEQAGFAGETEGGELLLEGPRAIPCGGYARWRS